jgi:hypothetical protein
MCARRPSHQWSGVAVWLGRGGCCPAEAGQFAGGGDGDQGGVFAALAESLVDPGHFPTTHHPRPNGRAWSITDLLVGLGETGVGTPNWCSTPGSTDWPIRERGGFLRG